jgi:hypothetical protein
VRCTSVIVVSQSGSLQVNFAGSDAVESGNVYHTLLLMLGKFDNLQKSIGEQLPSRLSRCLDERSFMMMVLRTTTIVGEFLLSTVGAVLGAYLYSQNEPALVSTRTMLKAMDAPESAN